MSLVSQLLRKKRTDDRKNEFNFSSNLSFVLSDQTTVKIGRNKRDLLRNLESKKSFKVT